MPVTLCSPQFKITSFDLVHLLLARLWQSDRVVWYTSLAIFSIYRERYVYAHQLFGVKKHKKGVPYYQVIFTTSVSYVTESTRSTTSPSHNPSYQPPEINIWSIQRENPPIKKEPAQNPPKKTSTFIPPNEADLWWWICPKKETYLPCHSRSTNIKNELNYWLQKNCVFPPITKCQGKHISS